MDGERFRLVERSLELHETPPGRGAAVSLLLASIRLAEVGLVLDGCMVERKAVRASARRPTHAVRLHEWGTRFCG